MRTEIRLIVLLLWPGWAIPARPAGEPPSVKTGGPECVAFRALPFPLNQVKLLEGPFRHATELNQQTLLRYEPDRFLAKFRKEAGLSPKAEHYHGWEDDTIAGHSLGHYLSACAMMYQATGDVRFKQRVEYMVSELAACQEAAGSGYLGATPGGRRILEEEVAKGDIRSKGFDLNGLWVPFYTQHKILSGLQDARHLCGIPQALEIQIRFAGWLEKILNGLSADQIQTMLNCEHGGINEALANLYADTRDPRHLKLARIFHHRAILEPLSQGLDILPGKHGNTQIPKLTGLARLYELTGQEKDRQTAEFFWDRVVHHHSYVTGGHGDHEYFGEPDKLRNRLSEGTTETCNVYNMLKLSEHLFCWNGSAEVAGFAERALFNHILSSQHPEDGRVVYNLSLDMGGCKVYQDPLWFTCCVGSGMENHAKYGGQIFYHNDRELFLTQFIAAGLDWPEKGLRLRQQTRYPEEQGTRLEFTCAKPVRLTLQIRYPAWAERGITIAVNGKRMNLAGKPGQFIPLRRQWKTGDVVEVRFPFSLRLEAMPDDPGRVAFRYGPLVLAGDLGPEYDPQAKDPDYVPVFVTGEQNPELWTVPLAGRVNTFRTRNTGRPRDIELRPFYQVHQRRYSVYFDLFTEGGWKDRQEAYRAEAERRRRLEEMTVDFVQPGEMQPERDHNFQGERTEPGSLKGRASRESRQGWFSFDLTVLRGQPMALVVEYWGGFPGAKTFDILVDGQPVATENISNKQDGQFILVQYDIPDALTVSKQKVTVKFQARPGNMAGPVFGVRIIKR